MSSTVSARGSCKIGVRSILSSLLYPGLRTSRPASLNSAIGRGLRRSKGVGFRGKERSQEKHIDGFADGTSGRSGPVRRTADPPLPSTPSRLTRDGWRGVDKSARKEIIDAPSPSGVTARLRRGKKDIKDDRDSPRRRSRAARFNDPNHSFGKKSLEKRRQRSAVALDQYKEGGLSIRRRRSDDEDNTIGGRRRPKISSSTLRAADSDRMELQRNPKGTKLSKSRLAYLARTGEASQDRHVEAPTGRTQHRSTDENQGPSRTDGYRPRSVHVEDQLPNGRPNDNSRTVRSTFTQTMDNRIPLSIPYTTPASEFLYGTSVVEAALRSQRTPRRKLYKLYIYAGENRDNPDRDAGIERLAKKNSVHIVHVDINWLRVMDKMSGGRPHNGYILEASPLPRLPITSLGELTAQNDKVGFTVTMDYQSREEAAINGTCNFIPVQQNTQGRKPFVLLLDSILDPGNLGGIIRTASFLGVTAIAISSRNSASFTPVVLKASAGASESATLFSVNKPAGFIADSKLAGWKVYAAVAPPSGKRDARSPPSITTTELQDPLQHDPCILMLGSEGEGLRWNLRSKAHVEIAVQGLAQPGAAGVDSLNVGVATGILCSAFLGAYRNPAPRRASGERFAESEEHRIGGGDLF